MEGCRVGRSKREVREGRWGWEGSSIHLATQLSALHFVSQIIKDDYCLPFLQIIILWIQIWIHIGWKSKIRIRKNGWAASLPTSNTCRIILDLTLTSASKKFTYTCEIYIHQRGTPGPLTLLATLGGLL